MNDLSTQRCQACEGGVLPFTDKEIQLNLAQIPGWQYEQGTLARDFVFKNFYQTMAFVNAIAWLAHQENHHPDLEVGYQHCRVRYSTHAIQGISNNDFICAAKVNNLFQN